MTSLLSKAYRVAAETPSDINEHVPRLRQLAEQCEHVTEFGVRYGVSTTALLAGSIDGKLQQLISYDITRTPQVDTLESVVPDGVFMFIHASSIVKPILQTDMLFIDSKHTRPQLSRELMINSTKVNRWIVMHDTVLFGTHGEGHPEGLIPAIRDFLLEHPKWFVSEHYPNNNGLTVLSCNRTLDYYKTILW